jgi:hypothetical protein
MVNAMGDRFQTLVDLDVTSADAAGLAVRALDWLVGEGIVSSLRTDCVLGARDGNPPGEQWAKAVSEPELVPSDGLKIETGRTVFWGGQGDALYAICPRCAGQIWFYTESWDWIEGARDAFDAAMEVWNETGEATVACRHCAQASDLSSWRWADDYFAFGYLGFEFWNWPEFDPRFLTDFACVLGGHRVVRVSGKL